MPQPDIDAVKPDVSASFSALRLPEYPAAEPGEASAWGAFVSHLEQRLSHPGHYELRFLPDGSARVQLAPNPAAEARFLPQPAAIAAALAKSLAELDLGPIADPTGTTSAASAADAGHRPAAERLAELSARLAEASRQPGFGRALTAWHTRTLEARQPRPFAELAVPPGQELRFLAGSEEVAVSWSPIKTAATLRLDRPGVSLRLNLEASADVRLAELLTVVAQLRCRMTEAGLVLTTEPGTAANVAAAPQALQGAHVQWVEPPAAATRADESPGDSLLTDSR